MIPYLMNCPHSRDGWCCACVKRLGDENMRLREELARLEWEPVSDDTDDDA